VRPLYVLRTEPETNTIVVGSHDELATTSLEAQGRLYVDVDEVEVKVRYRSVPVPAAVSETSDGFALQLAEPAYGVARGQFAVLYEGDAVVGAGVITDVA